MIPRLHLVTDDAVLQDASFLHSASRIIEQLGSQVALHIRGATTSSAQRYNIAVRLLESAGDDGARIIINDRVDIALASRAHGAQLGARSISVGDARRLLPGKLIGYSAHGAPEAAAAEAEGADFILAGSIYRTPSHPGAPAAGVELLRQCRESCHVPVLGIGGITPERVGDVRSAGAHGVAVIRAVWNAPDPVQAAQQFARLLES